MRNCPELLEEFIDNFLPADLKVPFLIKWHHSVYYLLMWHGHLIDSPLQVLVKENDNHSLDGVHMKEGFSASPALNANSP